MSKKQKELFIPTPTTVVAQLDVDAIKAESDTINQDNYDDVEAPLEFQGGNIVKIIGNTVNHSFKYGDVVTVTRKLLVDDIVYYTVIGKQLQTIPQIDLEFISNDDSEDVVTIAERVENISTEELEAEIVRRKDAKHEEEINRRIANGN